MSAIDLDPPVERSVRARPLNQHADVGGGHLWAPGYGQALAHLRETVELIRLIVARADTGELERFEGTYHRHDWSQFQGTFAPTLRPRIPIWIAANQPRLTRLVGEVADGFISHPIHSQRWTLERALPALQEGLRNAGRARADIHWNAWYYMAVNPGRDEALQDARATVAFYAQFELYKQGPDRRPRLRKGDPRLPGRGAPQGVRHRRSCRRQRRDGRDLRDPRLAGPVPSQG